MAINTSELGNTPTDMTNWDPDRTDEVSVPQRDVVETDAPESAGIQDPTAGQSAADQPIVAPEVPAPSLLDHPAVNNPAVGQAAAVPPPRPRPSVIARAATEPTPGVDRTVPIPAQRPSGNAPGSIPAGPIPAPSAPDASNVQTTQLPPASAPRPSQLPPRTEWLRTQPAGSNYTRPAPAPAPTFNAAPSPIATPVGRPVPFPTPTPTSVFDASSPPPMVTPSAPPPESGKRTGWLWPAIAAFVLGGLLTGLGFRIGTQTIEPTAAPAATTTVSASTTPPAQLPAPSISGEEPAAFVAGKLGPSVVTVETDRGLGSGVIFEDGLIMTNNHVIEGAAQIQVRLANGALLPAELVGADPRTDIAVVSIGTGRNLPIADLALGEELEVGELAIAIGSPFQLQQTVTAGIISALNRPVQNGLGYTAMIQTDAPINPGNSGGALSNREGRLIGINTSIQTAGDASNAGVGFAVPIDTAYNVALRIIAGQDLVGGFLGVGGGASADGASGVEVSSLTDGSGADLAGIREGDRIISIDGAPVVNLEQLAGIVSTRFPGDDVEVGLIRDDQELVIVATLGER